MKTKPTALLCADLHIRGDRPLCRTDDYMGAQERKLIFILDLANKLSIPILVGGDVGHRPYWGDKLLNWMLDKLKIGGRWKQIYAVAGQHDLPNHRLDKWEEGGLGVLSKQYGKGFKVMNDLVYPEFVDDVRLWCFPYGTEMFDSKKTYPEKRQIALAHQMVIKSQQNKIWHDQRAVGAVALLKKFPHYDLIVTGDNHQSFALQYEGRWLVNPGSMMRSTSAQVAHKPSVFVWYAETNRLQRHFLPIEQGVIDTSHIVQVKERDERIETLMKKLNASYNVDFDFEENMKRHFNSNRHKRRVVEKVWESLEV